jgi:hypothetical protein
VNSEDIRLNEEETRAVAEWCERTVAESRSAFEAARAVARWLGAHPVAETPASGATEPRAASPTAQHSVFGFWTPELADAGIGEEDVALELLLPPEDLDLTRGEQHVLFGVVHVGTVRAGEYTWAVADGLVPGTRSEIGPFYRLSYRNRSGERHNVLDPLAYSVPFGAAAPAELYDVAGMLAARRDAGYFAELEMQPDPDGVPRVTGPVNMLEIHTPTATEEGSLEALAERYRAIAERIRGGEELTAADRSFIGYDAVQLMPVEPTIVYEAGPAFFEERSEEPPPAPGQMAELEVVLRRPDTTNWGYDVMTVASPAPNPTLLRSGRPDELLDLISTLHAFPAGPIKVVLDVVYGHADNQSLGLLNQHYFAGANMYGQNLNYSHPVVRAVLLEMQRRKSNYGIDGVRVDGAQDFTYWVPEEQALYHDDEYLALMNDVEQEAAGVRYRPWMVFEDGRPWPRDDWELASSYREVTKKLPNVVQWGPLTFAHNTPFLFTFWISKWWRIEEILEVGSHWITGNSNHDTLRRGTQVDPQERINTYLGESLPQILANAYDNPASRMFDAFMPGIPMDFLNANMRAPWSFIRNTDDRYGVKVVSEEAFFLDWAVPEGTFARPESFTRLKSRGFTDLGELRRFVRALDAAVRATDYSLPVVAQLLNSLDPPLPGPQPFTPPVLKTIARAWMDDVHDYCTVARHADDLDAARAARNLEVREFARARPWLVDDLREGEMFERIRPTDGSVTFYGLRGDPDDGETLLFVANLEGASRTLTPVDLPVPGLSRDGWELVLATRGLDHARAGEPVELGNGSAVLFRRG